jgi:hypothetical protein
MGKTGPAILNYIQAQKWIPRDENLAANLKFAIQQTQDKIEPPPLGTLNVLFFWVNDFNMNELLYFHHRREFHFLDHFDPVDEVSCPESHPQRLPLCSFAVICFNWS